MTLVVGLIELLTLIALFVLCYVYLGYPLLLKLLVVIKRTPQIITEQHYTPSVTLIISCFNEEKVITQKIENSLAIDYPRECLQIMIVSDGSFDNTENIVKSYADRGIKLIRQEGRLGKTSAINMAMTTVKSEVVVFSDANAMYAPDAILKLVAPLAENKVGYVVGAALYTDQHESSAADSENKYWQYELSIKQMESQLSSVVGGDGAIYAIKSKLYMPLAATDINDFVNPLQIITQGYRGVFAKDAIAYEQTAGDFAKEAKRKQRIVNRSFTGLMKMKQTLNPFRYGLFSLQLLSHKLLRWLIPVFIIIFASGSVFMSYQQNTVYKVITILGIVFLLLAQIGFVKAKKSNSSIIFYLPYYFVMVNYYALMGIITALAGNVQVIWSPPRAKDKNTHSINLLSKVSLLIFNCICLRVLFDII